jgi:uncharacterized membrane protein YidH (DUF202 family)
MKVLAVVLIALGLVGLIYGGVSWTQKEKVVDLGPVEINHEERKALPVPPIVGGICLVGGIALLVGTSRRTRSA